MEFHVHHAGSHWQVVIKLIVPSPVQCKLTETKTNRTGDYDYNYNYVLQL